MTAVEKAPTILTRVGAEKLTARIAQKLDSADADLARAYEGRVWEALGLESWEAWVSTRLPDLVHIKLSVPARVERAVGLRLVGASERAIAAASGVSVGTAHSDLERARKAGQLQDEPATTTSRDGSVRPARQQPATAAEAKVERHGLTILMHEAWQRVAGCGDAGMTCWELERKARWRHGRASSLLHRLERAGYVRRDGRIREDHGVYVAQPLD